jgi:hypothetical protein
MRSRSFAKTVACLETYQILVIERYSRQLQVPPKEIRLARETFEALPRNVQQLLMSEP